MYKYILKRLILMIPVILGVTILIFSIMYLTPGDPAVIILGANASSDQLEQKREDLGLNDGYFINLGNFLKRVFFEFDFGNSYINNTNVSHEIISRFPRTLTIAVFSVLLSLTLGMPLGIWSAVNQYSWKDHFCMFAALIGVSMPGFWAA